MSGRINRGESIEQAISQHYTGTSSIPYKQHKELAPDHLDAEKYVNDVLSHAPTLKRL